ncbi:MAG: hypothetical protein GY906_09400 [bacterium]|nr:hypothetical protein [bacterium]
MSDSRSHRQNRSQLQGRFAFVVLFGVLFAALAAVFLILPKWQDRQSVGGTSDNPEVVALAPIDKPTPVATIPPTATPELVVATTTTPASRPSVPTQGPSEEERTYVRAMSDGLVALERRQWQAAEAAFERASRLRPNAPEIADARVRIAAGKRRDTLAAGIQRAVEMEQTEQWREAERTYAKVLALDPTVAAALSGRERSDVRAELDERLEYHARNPGRLSSPAVFEEASSVLEQARAVKLTGARLETQISTLQAVLEEASRPIRVVIESDNLTDVVIYKVGPQGRFERRELDLRPGTYTVVGSRDGYRDVRKRLEVTPKSPHKPLVIQCREAL